MCTNNTNNNNIQRASQSISKATTQLNEQQLRTNKGKIKQKHKNFIQINTQHSTQMTYIVTTATATTIPHDNECSFVHSKTIYNKNKKQMNKITQTTKKRNLNQRKKTEICLNKHTHTSTYILIRTSAHNKKQKLY